MTHDDTTPPSPISGSTDPERRALRVRTPEDLVALAPLVLGFVPQRSAVLISLGTAGGMHARVDLPPDPDDADDVVQALLRPALRNQVGEVVVLVYDDDTTVADEVAWALHEELPAAGVAVREVLRVHDDRWFAVLPGRPLAHYRGVRFSRSTHPFTAEGVLAGRVTHPTREALRAATVEPDGRRVAEVRSALPAARPLAASSVRALVEGRVGTGAPFAVGELAALGLSLGDGEVRDQAWVWLTREQAPAAVEVWSDAVRRLPDSHVAGAAAVLGFTAWLAGDGALAWCAVDRCREAEPEHSLASLVADLLESATSPGEWDVLRPSLGPAA